MRSKHALFEKYSLDAQVTVGGEVLTTPYHIYDGAMLLLGGTADAAVARSDKQVIRRFGPQDCLAISHPLYASLGFTPDFVQHIDGVRFVYLRLQSEDVC